ncbi:DUF4229 domain-containing protein [Curtobacterium sp. RRHDQ10]|uniref:DUF4229 domain-containing protein n=1 Tax=Curtobacterium phyllosphaerae TaxID=3413379 RepID=UPI003BF38DC9
MKAWLTYTLARLGIFAVVLTILLVIALPWPVATIGAALLSLLISYIALPKLRWRVATSLAERGNAGPDHDEDSDYEDDFVDAADTVPGVEPTKPASPTDRA